MLPAALNFVARRRLTALKRTATMQGVFRSQGQDRATYCIAHPFGGYAAKHPATSHLIPAPFRRSHTPKANPLRGIASQKQHPGQFATLKRTPPGRGKSQAIKHNRALPKVG